jgi:hypothetical protein
MMMAPRKQPDRAELLALAQAMLITAISARGAVPLGDAIRQVVREAREFLSEIDSPTPPKKKTSIAPDDGPPAEFNDQDELGW